MKFFKFRNSPDINKELEKFDSLPQAMLLDVRSPREYSEGHIPASVNIPSYELHRMEGISHGKYSPIFVYCQSGVRSRAAAQILHAMGYKDVRNIGGIEQYCGRIERSSEVMPFASRLDAAYDY